MKDVVIVSACRTAIGAFGGTLKDSHASKLAAIAMKEAIKRAGIVLREVRGVGTAQASSQRDSLGADPDWVAGDSVTASFAAGGDGQRTLAAITAIGTARARYRVYPEGSTEPDLSYSRGDRIVARFANAQLVRVDIAGATDGVYLEAAGRRRP